MNEQLIEKMALLNQDLVKNIAQLTETIQQIHAVNLAFRSAIFALIRTHPDPQSLFTAFSDYVDIPTEDDSGGSNRRLQAELQTIQSQIVCAVNSRG